MDQEIKKKWVAALRSGKYKQTVGVLRDKDDGFCCLGVLCDILTPEQWSADPFLNHDVVRRCYTFGPEQETQLLTAAMQKIAGLRDYAGGQVEIGAEKAALSVHNDLGHTFEEIAQAIEDQL